VILLPEPAATWDEERLASVLRHELVHARRADELTHAIAVLARALHWPNPLAWLAFRALVRAREQSCDDQVLATGVRPSVYATHLLQAASELPLRPSPFVNATPALAGASECAERVRAVLDAKRSRASLGPRSLALLLVGATALVLPIAALQSQPGALVRAQEIVALRDSPLDEATLALLLDALADDRQVEPSAIPIARSDLRQGGLPETTPGKEAARVLVRHGSPAVDALLGALEDGHPARREKAAWALGCIGDRRTAGALASLLARDPSRDVRRIAAWALGEMGARSERAALEAALGDVGTPVRAQSAHSLGDLRDARAVPALLGVIHDPAATVRERAAHALGDIADASAAPELRVLLDDRNEDVRDMARWALREMGAEAR
jgi:HEAT repeat protein